MTTVTVDTNALASGFVGDPHVSPPATILDAWRQRLFTLALSEHILTELSRTFTLPYFRRRLSTAEAEVNVLLLRQRARIVPLTVTVAGVATHPEDDLVIATAVSASADYLVTGDRPLVTRVPTYEGVRLLSPREFLTLLAELR